MRDIIDYLARTPLSKVVIVVLILSVIRLAIFSYLKKTPRHKRLAGYTFTKIVNELLDALIYAGVFVFMIIRPFGVQAFLIPSGSMWPTLYVNDMIVANKAIYRYTDPKDNDIVVFRPPIAATYGHPDQVDKDGTVKVDFIKRCIGTPGQVIELRKGVLYRNGQPDTLDPSHKHYSACVDNPRASNGDCTNFAELSSGERDSLTMASFKLVNYKGRIIPLNYTDRDANVNQPEHAPGEDYPYFVAPEYYVDQRDFDALIKQPAQPVPPGMYLMMGDNRNNSFDGRGWGLVPRASVIGRAEFIWFPISRMGSVH